MSSHHRLQSARVVLFRALCLGALLKRHELEMRVKTLTQYLISEEDRRILITKRHSMNENLMRWLDTEKITPHLTPMESKLLEQPLGTWSTRALMHTSWRSETLGMLLWSLRLVDMIPTHDIPFESDEVLAPLDIPNPTIDLVWCAELRPTQQLFRMRDTAELWDWRSQASVLKRLGIRPADGVNYKDVIRVTAEQAHADGILPTPIEGDFPAFHKSFASLTDDEFDLIKTISQERYNVMSWITECSAEWQSLPVDL
jgi:hypothetical protein